MSDEPDPIPVLPPRAASTRIPTALLMAMIAFTMVYLRWQGRVWWCACGHWWPVILKVNSEHNSQHFFDPYTLSHFLHGILFFGLLWIFSDRFGVAWRFLIAVGIELAWEMAENSPFIIDRYRSTTVSLGYTGDSILNSLGDVAGMIVGFFVARRAGLRWSIVLVIAVELLMLITIRDNLTLNIVMLVYPIDAIRRWQAGG